MDNNHLRIREGGHRTGLIAKKRGRQLAGAALLVLGFLFLTGTVMAQEEKGPEGKKPDAPVRQGMPVEAETVQTMSVAREITAVGTLNSNESVVITAEIAGRIGEISFKEGHKASGGQVLVRLDRSILQAQRDRAEASLTLSKANHDRAQILLRDEAISQRKWEEARAQWSLDEANLRLAQAQLDKTVLRAPFDGVLGLRHVSTGEYVQPGQSIVTLDDTDPIKIDFGLPEVYSGGLWAGQTVQVQVDAAPGRTFSGRVYAIAPTVDPQGRNLMVRAEVPNRDGSLRPGMFAQIRLVLEEKPNALMIPEQALLSRGEERYVYKVVDGAVVEAIVTSGLRQRGLVEITSGLSPGDTVVTAGQMKVRPGSPVTVVPAADGN